MLSACYRSGRKPGLPFPIVLFTLLLLPGISGILPLPVDAGSGPGSVEGHGWGIRGRDSQETEPGRLLLLSSDGPHAPLSGDSDFHGTIVLHFVGRPAGVDRAGDGTIRVRDLHHSEGPLAHDLHVPYASGWIALPPGSRASITVRVESEEYLDLDGGLRTDEADRIREVLPAGGAYLESGSWVRNQWGVPVGFFPVRVEGRRLIYATSARLEVRYSAPASFRQETRTASGRDPFESLYRAQFLNYTQGLSWRRPGPLSKDRTGLPRGDYFTSTSNPWIMIHVPAVDLYKITGSDLQAAGVDLSSVDPLYLRLFAPSPLPMAEEAGYAASPSWMQEVPITVEDGGDGVFDLSDQIVFFGRGPDGWYDDLGVPETEAERFHRDPYVNAVPFWLTWGGSFEGDPARIPVEDGTSLNEPYAGSVLDRRHIRLSRIWDPRPRTTVSLPGLPPAAWERFWWLALSTNPGDIEQRIQLDLPSPVIDRPVRVRARFWGNSRPGDVRWPDHAIRMRMNGTIITETDRLPDGSRWNGFTNLDIDTTGVWLVDGAQEIGMVPPINPLGFPDNTRTDQIYLAWIETDYTRRLEARNDTLSFFAGGLSGAHTLELGGFSSGDVRVLDATEPFSPRWIRTVVEPDGSGTYKARFASNQDENRPGRYFARGEEVLQAPRILVVPVPREGYLRGRTGAVDMIIVAHADLLAEAEVLAAHRRVHMPGRSSAEVAVVDVQEVMNEFGMGRSDPTAIRNFFEFARDHWTGGDPEAGPIYAVLLGDTHYDLRDFLGRGARVQVPSYEMHYDRALLNFLIYSPQFASDDYFAYLEGPGDRGLDIYLARIPARTPAQAATVVNKIIRYDTSRDPGPWTNRVTLLADDACQGTRTDPLGILHMIQTEALERHLPLDLQRDKIYLYDYGSQCIYDTKPAAADALLRRMNEGTLLVNFTGHGSDEQLADERIFELATIPSLTNRDRLFFLLTASCSVGKFNTYQDGLAEALILYGNGGCVATFTPSAIAFSGGSADINQRFYEAAFRGGDPSAYPSLGEAEAVCKGNLAVPGSLNSRRFALFGDPATRLGFPEREVSLFLSEAHSGRATGDTLRRGVLTDLAGSVLDDRGEPDAAFQGTVHVRIYDSQVIRRTEGWGAGDLDYAITGAPVYRSAAPVVDGEFSVRFLPPDALRTGERGKAQIHVFVEDAMQQGASSLHLHVPEEEAPPSDDREGPRIHVEFYDDPTGLPPRASFIASLEDSSGINVTRLVGSRSVLMQVEEAGEVLAVEDLADQVVFGEDYTQAVLEGRLPVGLAEGGSYELVLKASDNVRNSTTVRKPFTMRGGVAGAKMLGQVFNFPNPASGPTRFFGSIAGEADLDIQLFTLTGRRIWRMDAPLRITPAEFATRGVPWNGRDADGDGLANGVYLYKISVTPAAGGRTETTVGRLVVAR